MPPRIARSNFQSGSSKQNGRNKTRKRTLDAYSIASHSVNEKKGGRSHRLGEFLDDGPKAKKRRTDDDDGESEDESEDDTRSRQKLQRRSQNADENVDEGSDSEGNHWTMGELNEDDEDSDIDSDEAFGESDEEKFEGFTFKGSSSTTSKKPSRKQSNKVQGDLDSQFDLDEEVEGDEDDDDSLGDEAVDLATMLDDDDDDDNAVMRGSNMDGESDEEEEDYDEEEDDESDMDDDEVEDDDGDEERIARLRDKLENLDEAPAVEKISAINEAISVEDLLADLDPSAKAQFAAPLKTKKKSQAPTTLAAPLPRRQQDRIDRQLASKQAKEQLDRWQDTVMRNRRSEHLSFPLHDPNAAVPRGKNKFLRNVVQNELEANIQRIMEESGMATKRIHGPDDDLEDELLQSEELATKDMPLEEVNKRRAELRRNRELLFREEIKNKRIAKIKSKSYRRVHRKEKERLAEKEREAMDPEGLGLPLDEDEREELARKRAEERMSTKHRESKWAKSLKATNRTVWDENARDGVHEQARRMEDLKRRIAGKDVHSADNSDFLSGEDDDDDDGDDEDVNSKTLRQLDKLQKPTTNDGKNRLGNMKFMQAADARRRAQNDEEIENIRRALTSNDDGGVSDEENAEGELGRAIFGPKSKEARLANTPKVQKSSMEEGDSDEDFQGFDMPEDGRVTTKKTDEKAKRPKGPVKPLVKASKPETSNSWLAGLGPVSHADESDALIVSQFENEVAPAKSAKVASTDKQTEKDSSTNQSNGWTTIKLKDDAGTSVQRSPSDDENDNPILSAEQQKSEYRARAFAGEDVKYAFDKEKDDAVASEDEKEISTHLPGWGSWTGDGLSKKIRKSNAKQKHNPLFKTKLPGGVKAENRKDKGLENVIISEKQDRKGKKYLAPMLPHGFERKDQYERSLRLPLGPEWATKETFQRSTKPRVMVEQGIVAPMERPLL